MAITIFTILPMSAGLEQVFSSGKHTIAPQRMLLGAKVVEMTECLKSWIRSDLTAGVGLMTQEVVEEVLGDDEV